MTYTIEKVTTLIGARRYGDKDTNIGFILTDSRSLCFPEETLFFALKSERNDGHNYIPELYRRGVRNFVVTNVPKGITPQSALGWRVFATRNGTSPTRLITETIASLKNDFRVTTLRALSHDIS